MRRLSILLISAVMALTLIAFAVVTGASAAPKQQTNQFYGALDYSQAKGTVDWGTGTSKDAANQAAYNACKKRGATDCLTIVWVYNGYVAFAESSKFFDVGWGATKQAAQDEAVKRCEASSGGATCKATGEWARTDIDPNKQATGGYELPGP
jgi:Domain of unknown function (DUF4189)